MNWQIELMDGMGVRVTGISSGEDGVEIIVAHGAVMMTEFGKQLKPSVFPDLETAMRQAEKYT